MREMQKLACNYMTSANVPYDPQPSSRGSYHKAGSVPIDSTGSTPVELVGPAIQTAPFQPHDYPT